MAKSKPVKTKVRPIEPEIKSEDIVITEKTKVEMDSLENPIEMIVTQPEEETQTVIGVASAENLQKGGWTLIDAHLTPKGKEYKFRKVK